MKTVARRLDEPEFRQKVAVARGRLLEEATSVLAGHAARAAAVLAELLEDDDRRIRLNAARILLGQSLDLAEATDILTRLEDLERRDHEIE